MGTFKKGLFVGGLLGAGLMWLNVTKKGKEMRGQILDHAAVVYERVKDKVMSSDAWATMTKNQFVQKVGEIVDEYGGAHKLSADMKKMIVKVVSSQYAAVQRMAKAAKKK